MTAGNSLQDQILERLSQDMQQHMDFEILADVMERFGWTKFKVEYQGPERTWSEMMNWTDLNSKGEWKEHHGLWIFEDPADATAFALRWVL